ncbi:MAG: hypothetical protein ACXVBP_02555 [Flavisolibacter sp.]
MQNSFEKQVKEKMDELRFVPGPPVWENVEKQIRAKKDRRRSLLWLPVLFLLWGGGIWWISTSPSLTLGKHHRASFRENNLTGSRSGGTKREKETQRHLDVEKPERDRHPSSSSTVSNQGRGSKPAEQVSGGVPAARSRSMEENVFEKTRLPLQKDPSLIRIRKPHKTGGSSYPEAIVMTGNAPVKGQAILSGEDGTNGYSGKRTLFPLPLMGAETLYKGPGDEPLSARQVVVSENTQPGSLQPFHRKERMASRWQWSIGLTGGISGIGRGLGSFSLNKSADAMLVNSSPGTISSYSASTPSTVENGVSFGIGMLVNRKISQRLSVATGLQYLYYSTRITVGQARQDSTIYNIRLRQSVSPIYLNTGNHFQDYTNKYQFLSLPVVVDWQIGRRLPLSLRAGLSLQQLMATNALLYDPGNNVYYKDRGTYRNTQLFSDLGLSYAFLRRRHSTLMAGPSLQYGWSGLEKTSGSKHLYALGFRLQYALFKK